MSESMNRRDFVVTTTLAGAGLALPGSLVAEAPFVKRSTAAQPVVIASTNGNRSKDAAGKTCVQTAFEMMTQGKDVLDALVAGVNIVELDPADTSVGYGGLPNAEGVVQLDASVMHGPRKQAGAVACLEGVRTPSKVALLVSQVTDHHLLVGKGAQEFARQMGFTIEEDLNTEESRRLIDPEHFYGTINCNAVNAQGQICGTTTTSGLAWKIPGRVGDSPILGTGLYVDGEVGAAGSTGRGEANLYNLCSFLIVENLRRGMSPKDAGMDACKRIQKNTIEKRLLNSRGLPNFGINFYILNARGEHAGVALYPGSRYAFCNDKGPQTAECEPLLEGRAAGGI